MRNNARDIGVKVVLALLVAAACVTRWPFTKRQ